MRYTAPFFAGWRIAVVYHAPTLRVLRLVNWLDTDTAQYGQWSGPTLLAQIITHQVRQILYIGNVFFLDPIADDPEGEVDSRFSDMIYKYVRECSDELAERLPKG